MTVSEPIIKLEDKKQLEPDIVSKDDIDWEYLQNDESIREVLVRFAPRKPKAFADNWRTSRRSVYVGHRHKNLLSKRYDKVEHHYEKTISAAINMVYAGVSALYWLCYKAHDDGFYAYYDTEINGHWGNIDACESAVVGALSSIAARNSSFDLGFGTTYGFYLCVYYMMDHMFQSQEVLSDGQPSYFRWLDNNPIDEIDDAIRSSDWVSGGEEWFKVTDMCIALRAAGMLHAADDVAQYESFDEMRKAKQERIRASLERAGLIFSAREESDEE